MMLFLRSLLFTVLLVFITVIWAIVCLVSSPLPYRQHYWITTRWNVMVIWMAKMICGIHYQVIGQENLPGEPIILLSKHQSAWETIFLLLIMPRPLAFVSKRELFFIPFFGWSLALMRMIPIDRSQGQDAFIKVVEHGRQRLADGLWIIMFPEGTRMPVGQRRYYKTGGARLAIATNTRVIPIALNSGNCWPRRAFIKRPGVITVSIGKAISPQEKTAQQMTQEVESWIEAEMRRISPQNYSDS